MKLKFEKLANFDREDEPCSIAIPFKKGELKHIELLTIKDGDSVVPTQGKVTALWEDESIKWGNFHFLANLPANQAKAFDYTTQEKHIQFENPFKVIQSEDLLCIDNKAIKLTLNTKVGSPIFNEIASGTFNISKGELQGPVITDGYGEAFEAKVCNPWKISTGAVVTCIETTGKHFSNKDKCFIDYIITIEMYANKPWFKMDYKIINKEREAFQELKGIEISFTKEGAKETRCALGVSNYTTDIKESDGEQPLEFNIDANHLLYTSNEHIPEVFYGTFFADWSEGKKGGVCISMYQAFQNFPKGFYIDKKGIKASILPTNEKLKLYQGMAKTHTIFFHIHQGEETLQAINKRALQLQLPDRPVLETQVYQEAQVFDDIFTDKKIDQIDEFLLGLADNRGKAYGILHWGDAPDLGYTQQGRGNGALVWTNNEYDMPHAAMQMYALTGERRMLDYLLVSARHWQDVDVCHFSEDRLLMGGQIEHSKDHITGGVVISHEWVEGLLDYYHVTGDEFAYNTAIGIGENVLRWLDEPKYHQKGEISARETGWALRTLVALYKETYDEKWLGKADFIVEHFKNWKEVYGGWLAPYTDHTAIRVPFMIGIAVGSLMRYYRIKPLESIKKLIVDAVEDMVENCMVNGVFYYKELPSLRRMTNNSIVLEALANAYELTGDKKFLEKGKKTFFNILKNKSNGSGGVKKIVEDAVITSGNGPKGFAQNFYPITIYYVAAIKAGVID